MTAATLIRELADSGIRLSANGDKLHVAAPREKITPELRARLLGHKAELLAMLYTRDRLLGIARELGLPDKIVLDLPESELAATAEQTAMVEGEELGRRPLVFYLRSLAGIEPALPGSLAHTTQRGNTP